MCSARSRTKRLGVDLAKERGGLAHRHRARPERLDHEAVAGKLLGARDEPLDVGLVELDDLGDQQDLAGDAGLVERRLQPLVDDALVRGVLVDDDEPVARLRHDIGLVHLRARGAERPVDAGRAQARSTSTRASAEGPPTSKAACAASAKPSAVAPRIGIGTPRGSGRAGERRQSQPRRGSARRAEGRDGGAAAGRGGAPAVARERLLQGADQQAAHEARSRKRTSALAGCTLTSTSRGSSVTNSATIGWRSRGR